jgi:hypothetical protein
MIFMKWFKNTVNFGLNYTFDKYGRQISKKQYHVTRKSNHYM